MGFAKCRPSPAVSCSSPSCGTSCAPRSSLCSSALPSPHHVWFAPRYRQQSWRPPVLELDCCPVVLQTTFVFLLFPWCSCVIVFHLAFFCRAASSFRYSIATVLSWSILSWSIAYPTGGPHVPPPPRSPWFHHGALWLGVVCVWCRCIFVVSMVCHH